ncbi:hypothetical protein D5R40_21995 [Okeania hirsuta]|uniref:Uncharacterized protein n=1 Tax=Okeania hirsuta TaxID=1458930 RepID=A0A3N6NRZ0_9CYAN|nr:hypothetical protein D4Z78_26175 [Okeania hirsuta]RQH32860.1 hypothetical protein D5R40_21995 [Okeania hirsuta]
MLPQKHIDNFGIRIALFFSKLIYLIERENILLLLVLFLLISTSVIPDSFPTAFVKLFLTHGISYQ